MKRKLLALLLASVMDIGFTFNEDWFKKWKMD